MTLFLPETVLLVVAVILCSLTLTKNAIRENTLFALMTTAGVAVLGASLYSVQPWGDLFFGTYRVDLLSQGFKIMLSFAFLFAILLSKNMISISSTRRIEYYIFLTSAMLGMMMITSAVDVLTLYVSLELSSYSLYLVAAMRQGTRNAESSAKYLFFGAAASGFFLWGLSLVTGLAGSTSLVEITKNIPALAAQPAFLVGLFFVSLSLLFKLSGFPMHFWAPDVYESAATPAVAFIATASKGAAVALLIRILTATGVPHAFMLILVVLAFASMTLGNAVALVQQDVKRLLAYSSIAQAGYILVGLLAGTPEGYSSSFFYAFAYILMNTGAFLATLLVAKSMNNDNPQILHFDGLAERSPFLSLVLLLSLLSLAGIPPLVGFTGKWILFSAAMDKGHWFLVLWGVLNSVVSLFYYLTIIKRVYLEKPKNPEPIRLPFHLQCLGLFLFVTIVFLGIFPDFLITLAQKAIDLSRLA